MRLNMSETTAAGNDSTDIENGIETNLTRRRVMQTTAVAGVAVATGSLPALAATSDFGDETIDYASTYAHDPYIPATVVVETHESDFGQLDYIDDAGNQRSLQEDGYLMAERVDGDTPHNPVTLAASDFATGEYVDFPRGAKYDSDGDGDVDADDDVVRVIDSTHWTKDATGSAGTGSISDGADDSLVVSTSSQTSGDTMVFEFDLSTVADTDQTITDGMSRLFLQAVSDITTLESGVLVEFAIIDSGGTEVTGTYDPAGDTSNVGVMANGTGDSQVGQERVGELETDAAVELADIQKVQIRISDANADITIQGLNVERSSEWEYGSQEFLNSDSEIETQTVTEPSGSYSITGMGTIGAEFDDAEIASKTLDVEQRASELPTDQQHARLQDLGDAYDRPHELEHVYEFEAPSAYELDVTHDSLEDEGRFPGRRYLAADAATGVSDLEEWADLDNVSWTDRSDRYGAVGDEVQLLSTVSAADRTVCRHRIELDGAEADDVLGTGGAAVAADSSSNPLVNIKTILLGIVAGLGVWKRKAIAGLLG